MCCMRLAENTGRQKIAILAPSHNFVGLYLCSFSTIGKKNLLNIDTSSICPHHMVNFGLLTPEMCWQVWGTPANSRLGSVTARHSSSGLQLNFAALNRGRHLYSAGRPSRWALAYISSWFGFNLFYEHRKFVGLICFGVCLDIILMCHAVYALGLYT